MISPSDPRPAVRFAPTNIDALPAELTARRQWVTWAHTWRDLEQKWAKKPYIAGDVLGASSTDPATWRAFAICYTWQQEGRDGLGYVFSADDPYTGVDLDACRDPASGAITPAAWAIIRQLDSYTELTPSGTGVHIWTRGTLPAARGRKRGNVEVYTTGRYFTVTGAHLAGTPPTINERTAALAVLYAEHFAPVSDAPLAIGPALFTDAEVLERAALARNGAKFHALFYRGDASGYHSGSEAHAALCALLAYWSRDPSQIERLVSMSALSDHRKWARADYRRLTIDGALGLVTTSAIVRPVRSRLLPEGL